MRLAKIGQSRWTVLAVRDGRGACPVLDLLESSGAPGERLLADLEQTIPERGPPRNSDASKALRDKILELREPTTHGGTLRVLYFYDEGNLIVCANGVLKKSNKTPDELIDAAVKLRNQYLKAKEENKLVIETLPKTDEEAGHDT